ncbi:MAG TPA: SDR family NAD(P)-dependent oxidoreductase [Anaerolineaceae bacterium]|nr:SDR family NAD(P)-dependent oxidoreductase [Anaerolineaceae bacterium]
MNRPIFLKPSSTILVSGGARGITAQCVIALARAFKPRFILVGRSSLDSGEPEWSRGVENEGELKKLILADLQDRGEKPTPLVVQKIFGSIQSRREIEATLQNIHEAGGKAIYVSADIADLVSLRPRLDQAIQQLGPVTGLIHGAGSLSDKLIEKKSQLDFEMVYSPKINGLKSILECIPPDQLDFMVFFSSIVAVYGNLGQTDYAIANQILDQSARLIQQLHPRCRVISINWGPWEGGMVTPSLKKLFEERNVELIPLETGAQTLVQLLSTPKQPAVQVVVGKPPAAPVRNPASSPQVYHITRALSAELNPFVTDHVIGESPVLPATCAAAWMINACEQIFPGYTFFQMDSYKVLKGLVFDASLASQHTLEIKVISNKDQLLTLDCRIWSKNEQGKTFYHYSAQVTLLTRIPAAKNQPAPEMKESLLMGEQLYQDGTLFHGHSFQGIERIFSLDPDRLVMRCIQPAINEQKQGQFPVQTCNPFLNDSIVQCLLVWSQRFDQAPCLPSRLERLEQWLPAAFGRPYIITLTIQSHTDKAVVGDILVQDSDGNVVMKFTGLEGTISPMLKRRIGVRTSESA